MLRLQLLAVALTMAMVDSALVYSTSGLTCDNCRPLMYKQFQFYLPVCNVNPDGEKNTFENVCDAICAKVQGTVVNKGSCNGCENKCPFVFTPVCSQDQKQLYANPCYAHCAGDDTFTACAGIDSVNPAQPYMLYPRYMYWYLYK